MHDELLLLSFEFVWAARLCMFSNKACSALVMKYLIIFLCQGVFLSCMSTLTQSPISCDIVGTNVTCGGESGATPFCWISPVVLFWYPSAPQGLCMPFHTLGAAMEVNGAAFSPFWARARRSPGKICNF